MPARQDGVSKEVDMFSHRAVHGFRHTEPLAIGFPYVIVSFLAVEIGPEPQLTALGSCGHVKSMNVSRDLSSTHTVSHERSTTGKLCME